MSIKKSTKEYAWGLSNIQIGIDDTDHICFFCPECNFPLKVSEVKTDKNKITKEKCTWIILACHNCKRIGQRKFYWTTETGKFCIQRTR